MPRLPDFFARYPAIELAMSERDRWVDPVQEGVDCVLRYGELPDSDLVARRIALLDRVTCAAPAYLERFGVPATIDDLAGHRIVGIRLLSTGSLTPVEFQMDGTLCRIEMPAPFSVTGPESYLLGVQLGLGLAQVPRFHVERDLATGALVELLTAAPPPSAQVSLLYPAVDSFHLVSESFSIGRHRNLPSAAARPADRERIRHAVYPVSVRGAGKQKASRRKPFNCMIPLWTFGAGKGTQTLAPALARS
jgi:DNA-binding transcriptional LysR family regulator